MKPLILDGLVTAGDERRWAVLSPDGLYRYALGVTWDESLPLFDVTMLNPSVATHEVDDRTFSNVLHFGRQEECGGVLLRNLSALVSTDPKRLYEVTDCIGPRNFEVLAIHVLGSKRVAAWGALPKKLRLRLGSALAASEQDCRWSLGATNDGSPRHPCRLPYATRLTPWGTRS